MVQEIWIQVLCTIEVHGFHPFHHISFRYNMQRLTLSKQNSKTFLPWKEKQILCHVMYVVGYDTGGNMLTWLYPVIRSRPRSLIGFETLYIAHFPFRRKNALHQSDYWGKTRMISYSIVLAKYCGWWFSCAWRYYIRCTERSYWHTSATLWLSVGAMDTPKVFIFVTALTCGLIGELFTGTLVLIWDVSFKI